MEISEGDTSLPQGAEAAPGERIASRSVFGENMRYFRLLAGLSQEELAARIGWPGEQVSLYETGRDTTSNPTLALICRVAEGLGVEPSRLIDKPGERPVILSVAEAAERLGVSLHRARNAILGSGQEIRVASNIYVLETHLELAKERLKPLKPPKSVSQPKPPRLLRSMEVAARLKVSPEEAERLIRGAKTHVRVSGHYYLPEGELAGLRKAAETAGGMAGGAG